ncbi:glycosyltransferase family 2 protein [Desulforamulus ferrireducens]|uniref:Glycosyltransferase 2-like domain-containing protein n=1 Tax=Desulforamulus ferrireducens TaxID=1833852 RepID=A0A1S6IVJ5_9FIRM|nr:glycosyltransferase [Desulforamulus ferrireducens]AQS58811.1 hypothetical protein B0537_06775 [Desulforamulus ferrireducens]
MEKNPLAPTHTQEPYSPLVTIIVLAYNHLSYTKQCIESLYQYTSHIDFELITINNGSTDGTEEYFNSLPNTKKISFPENMGVCKAINYGIRMAQGKYTLNLSNDIVVTYNWLDNLLTCMESDEKIGMVVPVCNSTSNYQQITLKYSSLTEMQQRAKEYNVSNSQLWEERLRLVTYTCLFRTDLLQRLGGFDEDFNPGAFDDDAISFTIRRLGYKLILAKDTFVHHFGSITFKAEYAKNNLLQKNKILFFKKFGVYSWQATFIDQNVLQLLSYKGQDNINILGIGMSYGATLLQIKNICQRHGSKNIKLYYLSEQKQNLTDLKTICEFCVHTDTDNLLSYFGDRLYDYIIVESESNKLKNIDELFSRLAGLLKKDGEIVCTAANQAIYHQIKGVLFGKGLTYFKSIKDYYLGFSKPVGLL